MTISFATQDRRGLSEKINLAHTHIHTQTKSRTKFSPFFWEQKGWQHTMVWAIGQYSWRYTSGIWYAFQKKHTDFYTTWIKQKHDWLWHSQDDRRHHDDQRRGTSAWGWKKKKRQTGVASSVCDLVTTCKWTQMQSVHFSYGQYQYQSSVKISMGHKRVQNKVPWQSICS